ncbi:DUF2510 domain-containing protein [Propionibacteriaceae bacterium G1746]
MAEAGWYPDPAGGEGYRYWDGDQWSAQTQLRPGGTSAAPGAGHDPSTPIVVKGSSDDDEDEPRAGLWSQVKGPVVIIAIVLVTIIALIWALMQLGVLGNRGPGPSNPTEFCPAVTDGNYSVDPHPRDGRVYGGELSYPQLGAPWSAPTVDGRVPFGRDVQTQTITIEQNYRPGQNWVASVLVGELIDGDGFQSPEAGMDMVARCIVGAFYGDSPVQREDVTRRPMVVDGREAFMLEMHLSFDVRGLQAKGETAIIIIVNTSGSKNSIYYASIPDNAQQYLPTARDLVNQLRVGG